MAVEVEAPERLMRFTKAELIQKLKDYLDENDREHGRRLRLQAASAMNLFGGRTYEEELGRLHARVAELEIALEQAREQLRLARGESVPGAPVPARGDL